MSNEAQAGPSMRKNNPNEITLSSGATLMGCALKELEARLSNLKSKPELHCVAVETGWTNDKGTSRAESCAKQIEQEFLTTSWWS